MPIVTVSITDTEEVTMAKLEDMRVRNIRILVLFVWVVHRYTSFCCKWKLSYDVLNLLWLQCVSLWIRSWSICLSEWGTLNSLYGWVSLRLVILCRWQTPQLLLFVPIQHSLIIFLFCSLVRIYCKSQWLESLAINHRGIRLRSILWSISVG